jgi:hypothetical protein
MTPGGCSRRIGKDFYLNDKRYEQYEKKAVDEITRKLSPLIKTTRWKQMDYTARLEVMQKFITRAKEQARKQVLIQINRGEL